MRTLLAIAMLGLSFLLGGCKASSGSKPSLFSRQTSSNGNGNLFMGTPPATPASANGSATASTGGSGGSSGPSLADTGALASVGGVRRDGVLAGRILDQENRLRPDAMIQVIDLDSPRDGAAPLSVKANRDGYFDINGLETGRSYRLVARAREGSKAMMGSVRVVPPNIRVAIWLTEEAVDEGPAPTANLPGRSEAVPPASLGAPIKNPTSTNNGVTTPLPGGNDNTTGATVPPVINTGDPSLMAEGKGKRVEDGFQREVPAPRVNVPAPGRETPVEKERPGEAGNTMPPPPPMQSADDTAPPPGTMPPAAPAEAPPSENTAKIDIPSTRTEVPSCVRVGHRVENFALYDTRGEVFELSRDRKGKLVLLDLWYTGCGPCLRSIPHLNKLQGKYGKYGLEIIGITYEQGTLAEKQATLDRAIRRHRLTFDYKLVFGGGGKGSCPVAEQLELHSYPTLVLLDENGKILYRCQGMDQQSAYELESAIYEKLFPRRMAGR
ncbi:MAG: redoxin family protein [Gemmataceae bacterium]